MVELLAAGIIIHGGPNGVWSPSHPHMYPPPMYSPSTLTVPYVEELYVPETPLTYDDGTPVIL